MRLGVIYDSPGDQKERGRVEVMPQVEWKLRAFTQKELVTAQKLFGVLTIGGGSARAGGGSGGS